MAEKVIERIKVPSGWRILDAIPGVWTLLHESGAWTDVSATTAELGGYRELFDGALRGLLEFPPPTPGCWRIKVTTATRGAHMKATEAGASAESAGVSLRMEWEAPDVPAGQAGSAEQRSGTDPPADSVPDGQVRPLDLEALRVEARRAGFEWSAAGQSWRLGGTVVVAKSADTLPWRVVLPDGISHLGLPSEARALDRALMFWAVEIAKKAGWTDAEIGQCVERDGTIDLQALRVAVNRWRETNAGLGAANCARLERLLNTARMEAKTEKADAERLRTELAEARKELRHDAQLALANPPPGWRWLGGWVKVATLDGYDVGTVGPLPATQTEQTEQYPNDYRIGSVVHFKSGGPPMTVSQAATAEDPDKRVIVAWYSPLQGDSGFMAYNWISCPSACLAPGPG